MNSAGSLASAGRGSRANEHLEELLAAIVVTTAGEEWTGRDLVAAGTLSGRWIELERDLIHGLAVMREWTPPRNTVKAGTRALRYARNLISGEDYSNWLSQRQLTPNDVDGVISRRLAREHAPDHVADRVTQLHGDALAALPAESVCTGALLECGKWLVDRVLSVDDQEGPDADEGALDAALARERGLLVCAAIGDSKFERRARMKRLVCADAALTTLVTRLCTDRRVSAILRRRELDWLELDVVTVAGDEPGPISEVAALLREGTPLDVVGTVSGLQVQASRAYLEETPESAQGLLAAATSGDVIGPVIDDGMYVTWLLNNRSSPKSDDSKIRAKASTLIVAEELRRRQAGKVQWHERH